MGRRWCIVLLALGAPPLIVWGYGLSTQTCWVGATDLEVAFTVSNAGTGNPLSGARIEVQSEGGFYAEDFKQEFVLVADDDGVARKTCRRSMCFGCARGWSKGSFGVHRPWWRFRAVAEGYEPGEWADLNVPGCGQVIPPTRSSKPMLLVPVLLHKRST